MTSTVGTRTAPSLTTDAPLSTRGLRCSRTGLSGRARPALVAIAVLAVTVGGASTALLQDVPATMGTSLAHDPATPGAPLSAQEPGTPSAQVAQGPAEDISSVAGAGAGIPHAAPGSTADAGEPDLPDVPGTGASSVGAAGAAGGAVAGATPAAPDSVGPQEDGSAKIVTPEQFGAAGDGVQDDTLAVQAALDAVDPGGTILFTPGATYLHSDVLHLTTSRVSLVGTDATLTATRELRSVLHLDADGVVLRGLTLRLASSSQRFHAWEQMKLRISGDDVVVRDVHVRGAAAAGIYVGNGSARFLLDRVTVSDSRADGIHITGGARDGRVIAPVTTATGDDGVAVVSYQADGAPCTDIRIESPTVNGTTWGRGISVVGGRDVVYTDVTIRDTDAAGVYIGSEGEPYFTYGSQHVLVDGGTVERANRNPEKDHGAVLVYAGNAGTRTTDVTVRGLTITETRPGASWDVGLLTDAKAKVERVTFSGLTATDGSRAGVFYTNAPGAVRLLGVVRDGALIGDRRGW